MQALVYDLGHTTFFFVIKMIDTELLKKYGATEKNYTKNQVVFNEGATPNYYYQVISGEIKMNNINELGKEFIQGIFSAGRSFGEPPLLSNYKYPASAVTTQASVIIRLAKDAFLKLLKENPEVHLQVTQTLSERLYYKAIMATEIASSEADQRILTLIDYLKNSIYKIEGNYTYEVELTRQQIADLTGLRVETVIRTVKKLAQQGTVKITKGKIYR